MRTFFRMLRKAAAAQMVLLLAFVSLGSAERRISRRNVDPACVYIHIRDDETPLNIHLFRVDLQNPGIDLEPVLGLDGHPGLEPVLDMVKRRDTPNYDVLMAVNGDFWIKSVPRGLTVLAGRITRTPSRWSSIAFSQDKRPQIGIFKTQIYLTDGQNNRIPITSINRPRTYNNIVLFTDAHGDETEDRSNGKSVILDPEGKQLPAEGRVVVRVKKIFNTIEPSSIPDGMWVLSSGRSEAKALNPLKRGARWTLVCDSEPADFPIHDAVSGGPRILRNGEVSVEYELEGQRAAFVTERHPRTAIGYSQDRKYLILAVVDGRQPGYSIGMGLNELAVLMKEFGCAEAINLDGGGSSTMIVEDKIVNRPSDLRGPRAVSIGFLVARKHLP
jgi:hypothetical protein